MTYKTSCPLYQFPFWQGAKDFASKLTIKEFNQIEEYLESDACWSETEINDLFWFNAEELCEEMKDFLDDQTVFNYDEIMRRERNV